MTSGSATAIYARISLDVEGTSLGVQRQIEDCRQKAESLGWTVAEVYIDNDVSAYRKKQRPEYQRLLRDLSTRRLDAVVVYDLDRLTRRLAELVTFMDLHQELGFDLANVSGEVDLNTANGRMLASIKGAVAQQESERIGERVRRKKLQQAQAGIPQGGTVRVYGYTRKWTVVEPEAEVLREAFRRRAAGESLSSICKDFCARGLRTVAGVEWSSGTLSNTLQKPGYTGLRSYRGEIIGPTAYPTIIDRPLWDAVQIAIKDGSARGKGARRYLLPGFLRCGKCLRPMQAAQQSGQAYVYRCAKIKGGCGKVAIRMDWVDDAVREAVLDHMDSRRSRTPEASSALDARSVQTKVLAVAGEITQAQAAITNGDLTMATALPILKGLEARHRVLMEQQAVEESKSIAPWWITTRIEWASLNLSQRRALLDDDLVAVIVNKAKRRGRATAAHAHQRLELHYKDGTKQRLGPMITIGVFPLSGGDKLTDWGLFLSPSD